MDSRCALPILLILLTTSASADVYIVRPDGTGDYPTIQAAINAASDGDIIELTNGTFTGEGNRAIDYLGKAVTVRSQSEAAAACVIDCEQADRGVDFQSLQEGPDTILEGVTIANGYSVEAGGGIRVGLYGVAGSPTIRQCILSNNVGHTGGGIYLSAGAATIEGCLFIGNVATVNDGGGLGCSVASPLVENCTFVQNEANNNGGGLATVHVGASPEVRNCIFFANSAIQQPGGGVGCQNGGTVTLECCDIYANTGSQGGGDWVDCIADQFGIDGNISDDPLFCDPGSGDYRISASSPCAPFSPPNTECDLIGAYPVGCGSTPIESTTWGSIKALFSP